MRYLSVSHVMLQLVHFFVFEDHLRSIGVWLRIVMYMNYFPLEISLSRTVVNSDINGFKSDLNSFRKLVRSEYSV